MFILWDFSFFLYCSIFLNIWCPIIFDDSSLHEAVFHDELFLSGSMEESQVCTGLAVIGVWASFSIDWFRPVSAEPCWSGYRAEFPFPMGSQGSKARWCVVSMFFLCLGLIVELSPLFFRPKLSREESTFFSLPKMVLLLQLRILFLTWIHVPCQCFLAPATKGIFSFYRVFNTLLFWLGISAKSKFWSR